MIIMVIIIGKLMHAFGADFCVVGSASAFIGGTFVFTESKPDNFVVFSPAYLLGNGVVCVKDISGSGGYAEFYLFKNDFRTAVANDLVAEKVCDKNIIRGDFFYKEAEPAFVNFKNGKIRFYLTFKSAVVKKRGGDSAKHIGTEAVIDHGISVFAENVSNHVGSGGFSVGSGDADDFSAEFKIFKNVRADDPCNIAGFCSTFSNKASDKIENSANADGNE